VIYSAVFCTSTGELHERLYAPYTIAQLRQALGTDRFDLVFAAGVRLNQREAVAAVRDRHAARR
jgi:hypothetical protein